MADLGFLPAVRRILDQTPKTGQRMLFSATLDSGVNVLVKRFLDNPATHEADSAQSPISQMDHHVLHVHRDQRVPVLVDLTSAPGRTIVFTRTKHGAKALARQLNARGVPTVELHGNLAQNARTRNMEAFHSGKASTLVATDIAARGIHVDDVALVVHADPPAEHKAYLHRSGRTARAGAAGTVITMMTDQQVKDVRTLTRAAGINPTTTRVSGPGHALLAGARSRRARPGRRWTARRPARPGATSLAAVAAAVVVVPVVVPRAAARAVAAVRRASRAPAAGRSLRRSSRRLRRRDGNQLGRQPQRGRLQPPPGSLTRTSSHLTGHLGVVRAWQSWVMEVLTPRDVPLGGLRAMTVRRTLPQRQRSLIGAWCFLDHYGPDEVDRSGEGMVVPPHPHTGLQTVSWLFTGEIEHRDSAGHHATVRPGELNLMTAGRGISHSEYSTPGTTTLHGAQLWLALPDGDRQVDPTFEHHAPEPVTGEGWEARVFIGSLLGSTSPVKTYSPLLGAELTLEAGTTLTVPVDPSYELGVLVDTGSVRVDGKPLATHELGFVEPGADSLELTATEDDPAAAPRRPAVR